LFFRLNGVGVFRNPDFKKSDARRCFTLNLHAEGRAPFCDFATFQTWQCLYSEVAAMLLVQTHLRRHKPTRVASRATIKFIAVAVENKKQKKERLR
jgi:hypothetical protein